METQTPPPSVPHNPPEQPAVKMPPSSSPKHISNIVIGFILLLLGFAGGFAFDKTTLLSNLRIPYLSAKPTPTPIPSPIPTPDQTANWKTYTDTKNTFSFKYPPSLQLKVFSNNSLILTGVDGNDKIIHEFRVNPYKILTGETLYQYIYGGGVGDNYGKSYLDGNKVSLTFKDVSQNSLYKIWEPSEWPSANGILIKFIQNNNQLIWFSLEPYNPGGTPIPYEKENVQLYNQILSTFKFSTPTVSAETAAQSVSSLPEVTNFLRTTSNAKIALDEQNSTASSWLIQVYESFPDHNATFGWYQVDKTTGKVTKQP